MRRITIIPLGFAVRAYQMIFLSLSAGAFAQEFISCRVQLVSA